MASTYSTNLKIELQATGENSGTWGTITNTNLGTALEQAIVGYGNPNYASDANLTLTYTDTNAAQAARALVLNVTSGVSLTATRELVVPTIQKQYIVQNNTTGSQSITVKTSAGTGITVPNGRKAHLYVNGTDVIYMDDYVDINGGAIDGTPIGANSASTGAFTTFSASSGATLSGGNLNFSGTAQRITGDMSTATFGNRLAFQTNTSNSATSITALPNGTGTASNINCYNNSDPTNSSLLLAGTNASEALIQSAIRGTGSYLPMTFYTGGSERARIETDGDIGIGTSTLVSGVRLTVLGGGTQLSPGTTAQEGLRIQRATGYATLTGINNDNNAYNGLQLFTGASAAITVDTSSNVGIGTASPAQIVEASKSQDAKTQIKITNVNAGANASAGVVFGTSSGDNGYVGANGGAASSAIGGANALQVTNLASAPVVIATNNTERMRIDSSGNVGIGGTANGASRLEVTGTYASNGGFTNGISSAATIPSTTTTTCLVFKSEPSTQAASFTLTNLYHYSASQGTKGSGSTITSQIGFLAESNLTGATNNYGFYSNIASGSNRWNFYAAGTAQNYFAGNTGVGVSPTYRLQVDNSSASTGTDAFVVQNSGVTTNGHTAGMRFRFSVAEPAAIRAILTDAASGAGALGFYTSSDGTGANITERARITSGGNYLVGTTDDTPNVGASTAAPAGASKLVIAYGNLATGSNSTAFTDGTFPLLVCGDANGNNSTESSSLIATNYSSGATNPPDHYRAYTTGNNASTSTLRFRVKTDGDVLNSDNSYGGLSDSNLKQQISDASSQWNDIKNVKVRKYKLNSDVEEKGETAKFHIGVIAQELEEANMNGLVIVSADENKTRYVQYSILYMKAVKALQEAMARIEKLEAEMAALKGA